MVVYSKVNDEFIFIPAAGFRLDKNLYGCKENGYLWTNQVDDVCPENAYYFAIGDTMEPANKNNFVSHCWYFGFSVRGVLSI